mgnify:CR=1 FL=1
MEILPPKNKIIKRGGVKKLIKFSVMRVNNNEKRIKKWILSFMSEYWFILDQFYSIASFLLRMSFLLNVENS